MSFWMRIGRWFDAVFGGGDPPNEVESEKIDAAIQLIQSAIEDEQRNRRIRRLRIEDLPPERQEALTEELARLLKKPQPEE